MQNNHQSLLACCILLSGSHAVDVRNGNPETTSENTVKSTLTGFEKLLAPIQPFFNYVQRNGIVTLHCPPSIVKHLINLQKDTFPIFASAVSNMPTTMMPFIHSKPVLYNSSIRWRLTSEKRYRSVKSGDLLEILCIYPLQSLGKFPFLMQHLVYGSLSNLKHHAVLSVWYLVITASVQDDYRENNVVLALLSYRRRADSPSRVDAKFMHDVAVFREN